MINDLQTWQIVLCWVLTVAALVPAVLSNRTGMARVALLAIGPARNRMFRQIILICALQFGCVGVVLVQQLAGLSAIWDLPAEFWPIHATLRVDLRASLSGIGFGAIGIGLAILVEKLRHPGNPWFPPPRPEPNRSPLIPRTYGERWWGAAVSVNAGIVEEIFFRLALPLVLLTVIPSVWWALGLSALIFGLAHRYQGWVAVLATTVIGAFFGLFYLVTGHLWVAMVAHILWDMIFLVVRPWRVSQTDQTGS